MDANKWSKIIALNARRCRADAQMTQRQVAEKMKCLVQTVTRIESGAHMPSLTTLLELAEALGVPPCRLLQKAA